MQMIWCEALPLDASANARSYTQKAKVIKSASTPSGSKFYSLSSILLKILNSIPNSKLKFYTNSHSLKEGSYETP